MEKILLISPEKCTGCRTCELACSFHHEREFNPARARVAVLTWERAGFSIPMMCLQCDNAACVKVCPANAISRSEETGAMIVDDEKCIRCKLCVQACPFGNTAYDAMKRGILKCDMCGGEPQCAKFCPSGAIVYSENSAGNLARRKATAEKFKDLFAG